MITVLKNVKRSPDGPLERLSLENDLILGWNLDQNADLELDGKGGLIVPAFLELHAHLREPGQEQKEDLSSGLAAAVAGGYGTVVCMPNTAPVLDDPAIVAGLIRKAEGLGLARLRPAAALSRGQKGEALADLSLLKDAGAAMYTDDGRTNEDAHLLRRGLEYAHSLGMVVSVHAEDASLRGDGVMNEGMVSEELGLPGNPWAAESGRIARDLELCELTGARLHIQHLSTRQGLEKVREAKKRGVNVTCEVCCHHLTLTDESLRGFDAIFKVAPPLRTQADCEALLGGLLDGTVDCLATDHAPHTAAEKERDLLEAPFGIPNIEVAFPLLYTRLVLEQGFALERLLELMIEGPAKVMGWQVPGLEAGMPADLTVLDLETAREVRPERFRSKAKFSPWAGEALKGWPTLTLVRGVVAHGLMQV